MSSEILGSILHLSHHFYYSLLCQQGIPLQPWKAPLTSHQTEYGIGKFVWLSVARACYEQKHYADRENVLFTLVYTIGREH